jgi:hypothetical protein
VDAVEVADGDDGRAVACGEFIERAKDLHGCLCLYLKWNAQAVVGEADVRR